MKSIFKSKARDDDASRPIEAILHEDRMLRDIHRVVRSNAPHCYGYLCSALGDAPPEPSPPTAASEGERVTPSTE